ncbi:MAG: glycosyltransferase family 2 protein [Nitrospira sp. NTP1]|nr:glycosyltransferase family 2 protein [Nitrospira sp. NTP1]
MDNESFTLHKEQGMDGALSSSSERPLVSVVIPTYKRAYLLRKAIVSALAQEQAGELFQMEIIVVDDCSPDNTAQVVAEFPAVQYLRLPQNRGASGARNAGIKRAKGKYIALLDDDDEFLTHKLMVQVPILEAHPEIGVLYGQSVVTGGQTPLLLWPEWGPSGNVFEEFVARTDDFLHPPTWLVRRELFEQAGFFDESKAGMEHYDMALRIAALTPWMFLSGGPVALSRLPATADADRVRRKARAAVCASIAHQRWWAGGGLEPTKAHLLKAVRETPWLLQEAAVIEWLTRIASTLAMSSANPVAAVKAFWREITKAAAEADTAYTGSLRRLLGDLLQSAALSMKQGSPRRAPLVAVSALLNDPSSWAQPARLYSRYRAWTQQSLETAERARVSP